MKMLIWSVIFEKNFQGAYPRIPKAGVLKLGDVKGLKVDRKR